MEEGKSFLHVTIRCCFKSIILLKYLKLFIKPSMLKLIIYITTNPEKYYPSFQGLFSFSFSLVLA